MMLEYFDFSSKLPKDGEVEAPYNYVGLVNQAMTCYLNSLLQVRFLKY